MKEKDFFDNLKFEEGGEIKTLNWDDFKDKIVILRVSPPSTEGGEGGEEPMPDDNIENPFEDNSTQGGGQEQSGGEGQEGGEGEGEGGEEGGEGQQGGENGEDDGEGGDGNDGEGAEGGENEEMKKMLNEKLNELNLMEIEQFLGSQDIKADFRTKQNAKEAIGNVQIFETNNKQQIDDALDLIFKK